MWSLTLGRINSSSVHCIWRSVWVALGLMSTVYVTVPDYPWGYSLYCAVTGVGNAPTMWLHEIAIIWAITGSFVFGSILWQTLQTWRNVGILLGGVIKRLEKDL